MSDRTPSFGTFLVDQATVAEQARRAEALGYDIVGCGEHVSFHGPVMNGFTSLACAAGVTERIRLMSTITLLPLYPATLAAKLGASLDVLSGGRFVCGVGVGGEMPREFEACGVPLAERGARTDEALELLRRLWSGDPVTFEGRFNTLHDVDIVPPPAQRPRPPIWVAGRKDVAIRRAARYGDGWLPYMYTPEQLSESIAKVRAAAETSDRDPDSIEAGIFIWSVVDDDGDRARTAANRFLSVTYAQDFTSLVPRYALAGDPDDCAARLREFVDAGASLAILAPASSDRSATSVIVERLARDVLPLVRR